MKQDLTMCVRAFERQLTCHFHGEASPTSNEIILLQHGIYFASLKLLGEMLVSGMWRLSKHRYD